MAKTTTRAKPDEQNTEGAVETGVTAPSAQPGEITVICHTPGGRRRLGRRWPAGRAFVPLADLSDTDIELLRTDPQFSVILPA